MGCSGDLSARPLAEPLTLIGAWLPLLASRLTAGRVMGPTSLANWAGAGSMRRGSEKSGQCANVHGLNSERTLTGGRQYRGGSVLNISKTKKTLIYFMVSTNPYLYEGASLSVRVQVEAFISVRFQPVARSFVNSLLPPLTFFSQQFHRLLPLLQTKTVVSVSLSLEEREICIYPTPRIPYSCSSCCSVTKSVK